jgi:hypothetical protein
MTGAVMWKVVDNDTKSASARVVCDHFYAYGAAIHILGGPVTVLEGAPMGVRRYAARPGPIERRLWLCAEIRGRVRSKRAPFVALCVDRRGTNEKAHMK